LKGGAHAHWGALRLEESARMRQSTGLLPSPDRKRNDRRPL